MSLIGMRLPSAMGRPGASTECYAAKPLSRKRLTGVDLDGGVSIILPRSAKVYRFLIQYFSWPLLLGFAESSDKLDQLNFF